MLERRGVEFDTIEYLKTPPSRAALERIVATVDAPPADLIRQDQRFAALGLQRADYTTAEEVVALLLKYPELMQRPIVIRAGRAVIARPAEQLIALL
ncbi:MAG: arsenate reductase [Candidatus Binataceae bacterium]|nr:arsenate reductase [Candidatus Binataceae bacterium]